MSQTEARYVALSRCTNIQNLYLTNAASNHLLMAVTATMNSAGDQPYH